MATIPPAWRVKVERGDAHRQTGSRLAVAPGIGTAGLHSAHHLLDHGVANHPPATAVRRQHLSEKHRQRLRRQKQPLAVIWQQRLYLIQQLRTGQQTEHRVGIGSARIHADSLLMPRHGAIARTCGLAPRAVAFALQLQAYQPGEPVPLDFPTASSAWVYVRAIRVYPCRFWLHSAALGLGYVQSAINSE